LIATDSGWERRSLEEEPQSGGEKESEGEEENQEDEEEWV
jgi:hypothetical protein